MTAITKTFLESDEVRDLTGRRAYGKQIAWLVANRYRFEVDLDGRPKVLRTYMESRLLDKSSTIKRVGPQLDGLSHRRR
jgi:hypothetical protein